jgi:hypothetical protein
VNWDANSQALRDSSGNNRHSVSAVGMIGSASGPGYGATVPQQYVYGNATSYIVLPPGSVPYAFSICTVTRYTNASRLRRIVNAASGQDFAFGHDKKRGVAFYGGNLGLVASGAGTIHMCVCACRYVCIRTYIHTCVWA